MFVDVKAWRRRIGYPIVSLLPMAIPALLSSGVRLKAVTPTKLGQGGGRLVGFIYGDPRPSQGFAWISTVGVHPDFQRRGLGAALLTAAEAQLTTPILKLTVRQSNLGAIALYEKFGYRRFDYLYLSDKDDLDANLVKLVNAAEKFFHAH